MHIVFVTQSNAGLYTWKFTNDTMLCDTVEYFIHIMRRKKENNNMRNSLVSASFSFDYFRCCLLVQNFWMKTERNIFIIVCLWREQQVVVRLVVYYSALRTSISFCIFRISQFSFSFFGFYLYVSSSFSFRLTLSLSPSASRNE